MDLVTSGQSVWRCRFLCFLGYDRAGVLITVNPGAYTAPIKSAKSASSGVALIEIYEVP